MNTEISAKKWASDHDVKFSMKRISAVVNSGCTAHQFLAYCSQRFLLKHSANFILDITTDRNSFCPVGDRDNSVDRNLSTILSSTGKESKKDLDQFIKDLTLNDDDKKEMKQAADDFCNWFESSWFDSMKSNDAYDLISNLYKNSGIKEEKGKIDVTSDDWKKLSSLFSLVDASDVRKALETRGIDTFCLTNKSSEIYEDSSEDSLKGIVKFCKRISDSLVGDTKRLEKIPSELIAAYYRTALASIEEMKNQKRPLPYKSYSLLGVFDGTCMDALFKLNILVFATYSMMKKLKA